MTPRPLLAFRPFRTAPQWLALVVLAASPGSVASHAQIPRLSSPAPARNYSLSLFSEQGYHNLHVRGASADLSDPKRILLTDLTLSIYTGDASRKVESVLLSPRAVLQPEAEIVSGPSAVRVVRDDLEVTGQDWLYDHRERRILIQRDARIVFDAALSDLLK